MKRLLIGPAGSGKTHQILDEFEAHLRNSDPLAQDSFFLLPSAEHTDRIITLLLQRGIKGFFFRRVTTLSSLLSQVFPAGDSLFISSASRFMLFREIFETRSWNYFSAVQKTPGFLNLMMSFIIELKESFIGPEVFRKKMNVLKTQEPELASKYEALAGIYEAYEESLRLRGLRDRQDALRLSREKGKPLLPKQGFKKIWMDGFFDFSNLQFEYLRELAAVTEDMTVTLTRDENKRRPELFESIRLTQEKLTALGFQPDSLKPVTKRTSVPALAYLERNLFEEGKKPAPPAPGESIRFFEAVGIQGEVEMIAREILHLTRGGQYRFSDFAILLRQIGVYESVIRSVFGRYEIPVEIHERERLKLSPVMETLRSLLLIFLEGWKREPLFNFLKSSYVTRLGKTVPKNYEWISRFENLAHQQGVTGGLEHWFRDWLIQGKQAPEWNQEKNKQLDALIQLEAALNAAQKPLEIERLLTAAAEETFGIFKREDAYEEPVRRDAASAKRLEAIFEEIRGQFTAQRRDKVSFKDYAEHFLRLLEIDLYSLRERNANRVQVYDISLARQKEYRVVFTAGLLEKSFPLHAKEDAILSDWERRLFSQGEAFPLNERLPRQNLERYLFYLAVTRPSEQLILSCPRLDLEGKESLPSFYLDETAALFGGRQKIKIKKQDLSHPFPLLDDAVSERELEISVLGELWHTHPAEPEAFLLYLFGQMLTRPGRTEAFNRALCEIRAELKDPRLLAGGYFKTDRTSATALETYAKCAYQYFSKKILKLQDPREDFNSRLRGTIYHQVLENYFKQLKKGGKLTADQTREFLRKELDQALLEHPLLIERPYQKELYKTELWDMLSAFVENELEALRHTALQPYYFEYAFGTGENPDAPALEFEEGGKRFKVVGKIDRVDVDPKTGSALVVDYKGTKHWSKKQVEEGLSLQLPIYLLAVENFLKLKPVGAQLRFLKSGDPAGLYHKENAAPFEEFAKKKGLTDAEFRELLKNSTDYMKRFMREIGEGTIAVMPRDRQSCDYCPYPAVCRIQKWRLPLIAEEVRQAEQKNKESVQRPAVGVQKKKTKSP